MRALAHWVILAEGWRRAAVAMAAGAVGALAMPPFGFWPALVPSLTIAVWLIDGAAEGRRFTRTATLARAAALGWLWGFGYFVGGLWWIGSAFLVEADVFAWLMPFGVLGLPAVLALFTALGFGLARVLWSRSGLRLFALAFGLTAGEWLRGHAFTGFPWNTLGMAFGQNLWLMQGASVVGLYGLTLLVVLVCAAPATLATGTTVRERFGPSLAAFACVTLLAAYGGARLRGADPGTVAGVRLRIMQPNLPQDAKFRPAAGPEIVRRYLALSDRATSPGTTGLGDVTHLVWPESAFPFLLHRDARALAEIARALPARTLLVTGAAREGEPAAEDGGRQFFNAIQVVDARGAILSTYDKVHLVPFGEYVPHALDGLLRALGLRQFVHIPGGFAAGARRTPLSVPGLPPVAGSVCYEAIFPDETMPSGARPGLILNVTNDAWFGDTPGPRQHFAQARLRSVERGLPLVRAANTGISAVIDPYGRVLGALEVGREGVLDSALPAAIAPTPFDDHGRAIFLAFMTAAVLAAGYGRIADRRA
jgi:apolipoprotein N-acyltransferase